MKGDTTRGLALVVLAVLILSSLTACEGSKITQENFDRIKTGMNQAEVHGILGEPTDASSIDIAGFSGTAAVWKRKDVTITIQLVNGKVVSKQFHKGDK